LATSRTIRTRLYQNALSKHKVSAVIPDTADQLRLDDLVQGLLGSQTASVHQSFLEDIAARSGTNQIVLGCTDLQLAFTSSANRIDSMEVLATHAVSFLR